LSTYRAQARFYVAQTLAIRQLRESHRQILVQAGEASEVRITTIAVHALLKFVCGQVLRDLREDGAAKVHSPFCARSRSAKQPNQAVSDSNRKTLSAPYRYDSMRHMRQLGNLAGHPCDAMDAAEHTI